MHKYWFLLSQDAILSQYVNESPGITYKRNNSIKNVLLSSHFVEPSDSMTIQPSTTPCGNCPYFIYLDTRTQAVLPGGIS